jgi:hypothetical protein
MRTDEQAVSAHRRTGIVLTAAIIALCAGGAAVVIAMLELGHVL